ncbi:hypothetical protein OSCI_1010004 [Kamptonema sp. PCC 6506]|nr:hypothetical protein OSCI_1010004 [Kamptonema sp. PCC 6506]
MKQNPFEFLLAPIIGRACLGRSQTQLPQTVVAIVAEFPKEQREKVSERLSPATVQSSSISLPHSPL